MDTKRLYVDFHVLQTVPPSCVNRDDTGSPKTAVYGGAVRARVSSQAWKHAMRVMFTEEMSGEVEIGKRTLRAIDLVADELAELLPGQDRKKLEKMSQDALKMAGITFKKSDKVEILLYNKMKINTYKVPISKRAYTALCVDILTKEEKKNGINEILCFCSLDIPISL